MTQDDRFVEIERYALRAKRLPPYNFERLPPPESYRAMELAFRPDGLISERDVRRAGVLLAIFAIIVPALTSAALPLSVRIHDITPNMFGIEGLPVVIMATGLLAGTAFLIAYAFLLEKTAQVVIAVIISPVAAVCIALARHWASRTMIRPVVALLAIWILPAVMKYFRRVQDDWNSADYHLKTEERTASGCSYPLSGKLCLGLIIVAMLGGGIFTIIPLWLMGLASLRWAVVRVPREFLGLLFMPEHELPPPGLWTPSTSAATRLALLAFPATLSYLTTALLLLPPLGSGAITANIIAGNLLLVAVARPTIDVLAELPRRTETKCQ